MSTIYERINAALVTLGKRKGSRDEESSGDGQGPGGSRKREHRLSFQPFSQKDLLQRLQTYKPLTWFARPAAASAVECAIRGWVNTARDTLECQFCAAQLRWPQQVLPEHRNTAADVFAQQLTSKHASHCPWRSTHSMRSLLLFQPPATPEEQAEVLQQYGLRQQRLQQVELLPDLEPDMVQRLIQADHAAFQKAMLQGRSLDSVTSGAADNAGAQVAGDPSSPLSQPSSSQPAEVVPSAPAIKLTNAERARILAVLGWDMEVLTPDGAGKGGAALSRPDPGQYSLLHLTGASRQHKVSQARASKQQRQLAQQHTQQRLCANSVLLACPDCKARVGLWNFSGPRAAPIGRVTIGPDAGKGSSHDGAPSPHITPASTPLALAAVVAATAGTGEGAANAAPIATALSRTIAGGSYAGSGATGSGLAAAGPFGNGSSAGPFGRPQNGPPVFGRPGQVQGGAASSQTAAEAEAGGVILQTPAAAGSKRRAAGDGPARGSGDADQIRASGAKRPCLTTPVASPGPVPTGASTPSALQAALGRLVTWRSPPATPRTGASGTGRFALGASGADSLASLGLGAGPVNSTFDAIGHHRPWCPWVYTESLVAVASSSAAADRSGMPVAPVVNGAGVGDAAGNVQTSNGSVAAASPGGNSKQAAAQLSGWMQVLKAVAEPNTAPTPATTAGMALPQVASPVRTPGTGSGGAQVAPPAAATPTAVEPELVSEGQGAAGSSQGRGAVQAMQAVMQGIKDALRRRG